MPLRSPKQELEEISRAELRKTMSKWVVNSLDNDYGFDFEVRFTDDRGEFQEVSSESFYIQLKASETFTEQPFEDLKIDHLKLFITQRIPVVLIKYYRDVQKFYWVVIQSYYLDNLREDMNKWEKQGTKRILITHELNDLETFKRHLKADQKRITKFMAFFLPIGDGIKVEVNNFAEVDAHRERAVKEYKFLDLKKADKLDRMGNIEESRAILENLINTPEDDIEKVKAIIGLIWSQNFIDTEEYKTILNYSKLGITLSKKLNLDGFQNYIVILKNQALLNKLYSDYFSSSMFKRMSEKTYGNEYSFLYINDLINISKVIEPIVRETNTALEKLAQVDMYLFQGSLPIILQIISSKIYFLVALDNDFLSDGIKRPELIKLCLSICERSKDNDILKMMYRSISTYYHNILENEKAISYMEKCIAIGKLNRDTVFVNWNSKLLENMKKKPNPYKIPEIKPYNNTTLKEIQTTVRELITHRYDPEGEDDHNKSIKMAIDDLDTTYIFKSCIHVHMVYYSTSTIGRMLFLESMGQKVIW